MSRRTGLCVLLAMLGLAAIAEARPGGGDSYSGGGGHGGSGGGGDAGAIIELLFHLIRLCVYYPQIGFPLLFLFVGFLAYSAWQKNKTKDWDSGPPVELKRAVSLEDVRRIDPDFSPILFEDFAFRLYATAHEARHRDDLLEQLSPYVSEAARQQLAARQPRGPVTGIVIGAMRPWFVTLPTDPTDPAARVLIGLELETNYSVETPDSGPRTYYAIERWKLSRSPTARSKPRDATNLFPCPNCGAPWEAKSSHETQQCKFCDQIVDNGRFDWQVASVELIHAVDKPPTLSGDVPERGTDLPTYRQDDVDRRWHQLLSNDPALSEESLQARLRVIYDELYAAWANNDLATARPYLSDGLHDYLTYWIDAYKQQGLSNKLIGMHITHTAFAKVTRDRWYDAVTIRIWGTGKDFVLDRQGSLVRGSKNKDRAYSEYWTLIRSSERRGPARADRACGNCGAPAAVGMTGACAHCGAHVTSGEFDWVLSKIEQDDSYRG